jgi:DNA-binding winged helix-turn-helix (wHTH) protein
MEPQVSYGDLLTMMENDRSSAPSTRAIEFGRVRVLLTTRELFVDGSPVAIGTRAYELLLALIEARGQLLSKDQLLSHVWPNVVVEENNLQVQISALRKALGVDGAAIKTEFGRGYRFIGDAHFVGSGGAISADLISLSPEDQLFFQLSGNEMRLNDKLARLTVEQVLKLVVPTILTVLSAFGTERLRTEALTMLGRR